MADWYYAKNGQQRGPVSPSQLKQLAATGELLATDMVIKEGGTSWVAASTIPGLFGSSAAVSPTSSGPTTNTVEPVSLMASGPGFGDYLTFRKTCPPLIISIFFWMFVALWTIIHLINAYNWIPAGGQLSFYGVLTFFLVLPVGILAVRLWCDSLIVNGRIHETLTSLKDLQQGRR